MRHYLKILLFIPLFILTAYSGRYEEKQVNVSPKLDILSKQDKQTISRLMTMAARDKIDQLVQTFRNKHGFHGTVMVVRNEQILYNEAVGYADLREKTALTKDSKYQLASVSKQFTAMSIMILKDQGKLDYDEDVRKYIPELPYKGITIRHLLNHTSGLPNYMWLIENCWKEKRAPYNEDVISLLSKFNAPKYFSPGRKFKYSNTGYVILASVVERISERKFAEFVRKEIFAPLGMSNSFVYSESKEDFRTKLTGYQRGRYRYRKISYDVNDGCVGDKGVYSTTADLYKWDLALSRSSLVSMKTLKEAFTAGTIRGRYTIPYGFGFRLKKRQGKEVVYHHGLWNGFRTAFIRHPKDSLSIVVLNHTSYTAKNVLVQKLENLLLAKDFTNDLQKTMKNYLDDEPERMVEKLEQIIQSNEDRAYTISSINDAKSYLKRKRKLSYAARLELVMTILDKNKEVDLMANI